MNLFLKFWEVLLTAILTFAKSECNDLKEELVKDSIKILEKAKEDIKRWIPLYIKGKLTSDELMWLIKGQKDIAELMLLKQKGVTKAQLNNFFNNLIEIISNTISKMFTPV
jgi:hypothetical protein